MRLARGLIDYPTGKSAMIRYGASDDVRAALVALAAAHPDTPWLCRHAEELPRTADPTALLCDLVSRFRRRFGAEPGLPETPAGWGAPR